MRRPSQAAKSCVQTVPAVEIVWSAEAPTRISTSRQKSSTSEWTLVEWGASKRERLVCSRAGDRTRAIVRNSVSRTCKSTNAVTSTVACFAQMESNIELDSRHSVAKVWSHWEEDKPIEARLYAGRRDEAP